MLNDKVYIGKTNNMKRRIREHYRHAARDGGEFHSDIVALGFENFSFELIEECEDSLSDEREIFYIDLYRKELGIDMVYNYCKGGTGGCTHDVSGKNNPMYGRVKTDEEKINISKKLKGAPKPIGFGEKVSAALRGRKKSPDAVAKKSHPISMINILTNEILYFPSKAEMERQLHCNTATIMNGKVTKTGWKLYS